MCTLVNFYFFGLNLITKSSPHCSHQNPSHRTTHTHPANHNHTLQHHHNSDHVPLQVTVNITYSFRLLVYL